MNIRKVIESDIVKIDEINAQVQAIHFEFCAERFKEKVQLSYSGLIGNENAGGFVSEQEGHLLGYMTYQLICRQENAFQHEYKIAYIDHFCVTEEQRNRGIGKALLKHFVAFAESKGFSDVELDVWTQNIAAIKAYESLGFEMKRQKMSLVKKA